MVDMGQYDARKTAISSNNQHVFDNFRKRLHAMLNEPDTFTRHYLIAMLWSSTDDEDIPLNLNYSISDIAPETIEQAIADCASFQRDNAELLAMAYAHYFESGMVRHPDAGSPQACAGHDFWLTRCGHGVGFWDRGMPGDVGKKLSDAAAAMGEIWPYVGDDGRVYL